MPDRGQQLRAAFLQAVFSLLGYVAACDQPLNREEIKRLKVHLKKMQLTEAEQQQALELFKQSAQVDYNPDQLIQEFRQNSTPKLTQILLVHLVTMARADGGLVEKELHAIQWLARKLGYKSIVLFQLLKIIYQQDQLALRYAPKNDQAPEIFTAHSKSHSPDSVQGRNTDNQQVRGLNVAYKILGVNSGMTEEEIRRAYKKLASQYHPDKLAGQDLTQAQIDSATEQFKKILAAYKYLKQHRFMYRAST